MRLVFWASLAGILYTYAVYPTLMWVASRLLRKPWKTAPTFPIVTVLLAVHNGISVIDNRVRGLLTLDYPRLSEIIVVSDGSTDGTAEFLKTQRNSLLKTVILEQQVGKAAALNAGLAEATGDIVLFVDIRPEIAPGSIEYLMSNFADAGVGCVSGNLRLRNLGHDAAAAGVGGFYWRYEQWIRTCEAAVHSPVGVYGGFYAIRRDLAVPYPAGLILDDMFQPLSVIRRGYRSVIDSRAVVYDTWPKKASGEFQRKVRTLAGNFQLFRLAPWTLTSENPVAFQLLSHKVMRLVVPYLFVLLLLSSLMLAASGPFAVIAALQIAGWMLAFWGLRSRTEGLGRMAGAAGAMLVLNAAAVVGFYKFVFTRGPLWKIWTAGTANDPGIRPASRTSAGA